MVQEIPSNTTLSITILKQIEQKYPGWLAIKEGQNKTSHLSWMHQSQPHLCTIYINKHHLSIYHLPFPVGYCSHHSHLSRSVWLWIAETNLSSLSKRSWRHDSHCQKDCKIYYLHDLGLEHDHTGPMHGSQLTPNWYPHMNHATRRPFEITISGAHQDQNMSRSNLQWKPRFHPQNIVVYKTDKRNQAVERVRFCRCVHPRGNKSQSIDQNSL